MPRDRIIRIEDTDVVVGSGRAKREIQLPPFSYSGVPQANSFSGRWHPYVPVQILWAQVTARVPGVAEFEILTSNIASMSTTGAETRVLATFQLNGNYTLTKFAGLNNPYSSTATIGTIEQYTVTPNQWIAVKCIGNDSCEDVVITLIGREMAQEGREA